MDRTFASNTENVPWRAWSYQQGEVIAMTTQTSGWNQVSVQFEKLQTHMNERVGKLGAVASAERAEFEKCLTGMLTAIEDGFTAAGDAIQDARLRKDLAKLAQVVRQALVTSVTARTAQLHAKIPTHVGTNKLASVRSGAAKPIPKKTPSARPVATRKAATRPVATRKAASRKAPVGTRSAG
ncbi:MAG: hypothetical protein ABI232_08935 [Jatrophihabitantaceae bacterium]